MLRDSSGPDPISHSFAPPDYIPCVPTLRMGEEKDRLSRSHPRELGRQRVLRFAVGCQQLEPAPSVVYSSTFHSLYSPRKLRETQWVNLEDGACLKREYRHFRIALEPQLTPQMLNIFAESE